MGIHCIGVGYCCDELILNSFIDVDIHRTVKL